MRILTKFLFLAAFLFLLAACEGLKNTAKNVFETSERKKYERSFSGTDSLMQKWQLAFDSSVKNQLQINDSFVFTINAGGAESYSAGYSIDLKEGDLLIVEAEHVLPSSKIFVDLLAENSPSSIESKILEGGTYRKTIGHSSRYKIIVQPEIGYAQPVNLRFYTQPSAPFPVAGKGNRDIQSFWGANRDGGARRHEGVDIFAKRGNPVVAAVNGLVTRTGNSGLGGKQVWLRDGILGNSLYYAHLDSIMTEVGQTVKIGDTLGTVGNTGNAEGGAPHLHFGIYTRIGAVDPYPFIRKRDVPAFQKTNLISVNKTIKSGSNLRSGAGTAFSIIENISQKTDARVIAVSGEWSHIKTITGAEGFVINSRLE